MACINKNITIVNDTSRVIRMTIVIDALGLSCGNTYDHHSYNSLCSYRTFIYSTGITHY